MDAHVKTVREILHSGDQFLVPFFQRHYSWSKEHWQRLLDDIIALTEDTNDTKHFLGPLVCTPFHPVPGEVTPYQLIDGQQRLATLTVALAALRDIAKLNALESLSEEIHEDYLIHRRRQGVQRFKVVPRLEDRTDYESIIEGSPAGTTMTTGLLGAYSFFKREWNRLMSSDGEAAIRQFLIAATARLSLVTITVAGENPYEIFESLNSTGLPLEESDLIRNFLFMQVPLEEQDRFQSVHWDAFEKRFDATGEYEKLSPTLFYRSYLMREGNYCRNKAAYVEFKKQNLARALTPAVQVEELQMFAKFELWLRRPFTCEVADFREAFSQILALDITTAHPLLLNLLHRHERGTLERAELLGCFSDLASFVLRRSVCGESTRGYGRLYPAAVRVIRLNPRDDLRNFLLREGWPDDAAFIPHLIEFPIYKRERNKCRLLLETLERQQGHKEQLNLKRLTVEHVLPQAIDGDGDDGRSWQEMLGVNWQILQQKWVHTLGNLTLTGYNPELGNGCFADKQAAFGESRVSLNQHFAGLTQWTDREVKQRGVDLAQIVARVWPRPPGGPTYIPPAPAPPEPEGHPDEEPGEGHRGRSKLLIRIHWSRLGKAGDDEEVCESKANKTLATFLGKLIRAFGDSMSERLTRLPVTRRYPLSSNPTVDFLNPAQGEPFSHLPVPGTGLYVFTNLSNKEKRDDLSRLVAQLDFPPGSVEVQLD
ncbi:MAG: hypothetical protein A3G75_00645 [Verrucomicrobia bacterium RIFCSPLOWO2_12_FULL_64_8]|nr:MAG: hypothetical protein A3G75_00645 [Verrucomicrobia bacterium RIFCSPLOWO2_12_FULL_64_8]